MRLSAGICGVVMIVVSGAAVRAHAQDGSPGILNGDWPAIDRDGSAQRYSPLEEITPTNVRNLELAWSHELGSGSTAVAVAVDGTLYICSGPGVVALDGRTGGEIWRYELPATGRGGRAANASTRGVSYWPGNADTSPRVLFTAGSALYAIDAETGSSVEEFGQGGSVTLDVAYGGVPTVFRNVAIIGSTLGEFPLGAPGNPVAFDIVTGDKLWEFQTVPQEGEPFNETWLDGWENRSGTNMWAFAAAVDDERGIAYLPISGPAANYYGGDRPGANLFANSIVAVDALTGEYIWHFQTVHHDLWDTDMPSVGALVDFVEDGQSTPAIAHVGKSGWMFVLDRVTGEPLIDVEERPVPAGNVPDEWYSPTQPFPVRPPPLSRVQFAIEDDLVTAADTTAEHRAACLRVIEMSGGMRNEGPFTPFLYKAADEPAATSLQLPGGTGGVNWGGMAFSPSSGLAFVNAHDTSLVGWIEEKVPGGNYGRGVSPTDPPLDRASIYGPGPYSSFNAPISGEFDEDGRGVGPSAPCYRPPWARLVAVDVSAGEIVWTSTLGLNEELPEGKQLVGNSGSAGPTVTAGGVVFVGATNDQRFRAFDARTGEEIWVTQLQSNANANPMSYASASGKQHVGIVAGSRLMVYALP